MMNNGQDNDDDEEGDDDNLEINCVDVSVDGHGVVTSLVVATDGESYTSYVVEHNSIDRVGKVLHEIDSWCHSLWRTESGPIFVVDNDGILHTNEHGRFRRTDLNAPLGLQRIREAAGRLIVCGAEGVVLEQTDASWRSIGKALERDLEGIDGTPDGAVFVVGDGGVAARIDAQGWQDLHIPTNVPLLAVQVMPSGDIVIAGEVGQFYVGQGSRWRAIDLAPSVHGLCCYGPGVAIAGGGAGVVLFDGARFASLKDDIDAQSVAASGHYLAVAAGDTIWRYNGKNWGYRKLSF